MAIVTMRELLESGIHFGHQTRRWHPKMSRYIYGQRNGIYIINLQHTLRQLYKAYGLVRDTVAQGGHVLMVGTKRQAQEPVQREAERCGMYYVNSRWLGGTLTNFRTVKQSITRLTQLQELETDPEAEKKHTKKELVLLRKDRVKLERNLLGIQKMPGTPSVVFVIDAKREDIAVKEAQRLHIPCIGVVDTNCDPEMVDLPIPGNDDAIRAVNLYCKIIADAAIEGRMRAEKVRADREEDMMARTEGSDEEAAAPAAGDTVDENYDRAYDGEPVAVDEPAEAAPAAE
ncbi:MAG: 30S ribosomal protein S2 [Candidatus Hydrogenedens sp.]|nr:30S ribosomal protein S2 [Candidatus Hydrogenedentota bacterium]NLF57928.1 30S ribosomal protein S2 [Candidatus Hydrogenedens sp.]